MATLTERDQVISECVKTSAGRRALAASMARPLRTVLDYVDCPACGKTVPSVSLADHASSFTDEEHLVVEVMGS